MRVLVYLVTIYVILFIKKLSIAESIIFKLLLIIN